MAKRALPSPAIATPPSGERHGRRRDAPLPDRQRRPLDDRDDDAPGIGERRRSWRKDQQSDERRKQAAGHEEGTYAARASFAKDTVS